MQHLVVGAEQLVRGAVLWSSLKGPSCNCNPTFHCPPLPNCVCAGDFGKCPAEGGGVLLNVLIFLLGFVVGILAGAYGLHRISHRVVVVDTVEEQSPPPIEQAEPLIPSAPVLSSLREEAEAQVLAIRRRHGSASGGR